MPEKTTIYFEEDGNINDVKGKKITVVGYGNQGRAQALNMKDSGLDVIIGNKDDDYKKTALSDGFEVFDASNAQDLPSRKFTPHTIATWTIHDYLPYVLFR